MNGILPTQLDVMITGRCNAFCPYCVQEATYKSSETTDDTAFLDAFKPILETVAKLGVNRFVITGGEPLLPAVFERTLEVVEAISGIPGTDTILYTNGEYLTAELLGKLKEAGLRSISLSVQHLNDGTNCMLFGTANKKPTREICKLLSNAALPEGFRLNVVMQKGGVEDATQLLEYIKFAAANGAKDVYARELVAYTFDAPQCETNRDPIRYALKNRVPAAGIVESLRSQFAEVVEVKEEHREQYRDKWHREFVVKSTNTRFWIASNRLGTERDDEAFPYLVFMPDACLYQGWLGGRQKITTNDILITLINKKNHLLEVPKTISNVSIVLVENIAKFAKETFAENIDDSEGIYKVPASAPSETQHWVSSLWPLLDFLLSPPLGFDSPFASIVSLGLQKNLHDRIWINCVREENCNAFKNILSCVGKNNLDFCGLSEQSFLSTETERLSPDAKYPLLYSYLDVVQKKIYLSSSNNGVGFAPLNRSAESSCSSEGSGCCSGGRSILEAYETDREKLPNLGKGTALDRYLTWIGCLFNVNNTKNAKLVYIPPGRYIGIQQHGNCVRNLCALLYLTDLGYAVFERLGWMAMLSPFRFSQAFFFEQANKSVEDLIRQIKNDWKFTGTCANGCGPQHNLPATPCTGCSGCFKKLEEPFLKRFFQQVSINPEGGLKYSFHETLKNICSGPLIKWRGFLLVALAYKVRKESTMSNPLIIPTESGTDAGDYDSFLAFIGFIEAIAASSKYPSTRISKCELESGHNGLKITVDCSHSNDAFKLAKTINASPSPKSSGSSHDIERFVSEIKQKGLKVSAAKKSAKSCQAVIITLGKQTTGTKTI